jgi:hypothetical protein
MGNALRRLDRSPEALAAYREGTERFPADPFLRLRAACLLLALGQTGSAQALINPVASQWPRIRERMFILPQSIPNSADQSANPFHFPKIPAIDRAGVWLICADPVYIERHGVRLAQSIARSNPDQWHFHCHVIRTADTALPALALNKMSQTMNALTLSERVIAPWGDAGLPSTTPMPHSARKARYACERLLVLPGLLRQVKVPVLCTDIDLECLDSCSAWLSAQRPQNLALLGGKDPTVEPWETFNASVMLANPTSATVEALEVAGTLASTILANHPDPWFADQVALHRIWTELPSVRIDRLDAQLIDHHTPERPGGSPRFRTHHGSWAELQPSAGAPASGK